MGKLSKNSSVPLYQQLINEIKTQIAQGQLKENDKIPTETELSQIYDISRITVRKAIELLVEDEILIKRQGIGSFVAALKLNRNANGFMGFTQSCLADGRKPGTKLLTADLADPTLTDKENLMLEDCEKIIRIIRLRLVDDYPVMLEENHFPTKYAFLFGKDLNSSLYQILNEAGIQMSRGVKQFGICYANEIEEQMLHVKKGTALLMVKDISYDSEGNPVHTCKSVINPERYKFMVTTNS